MEKACASGRCVDTKNVPGLSKSLGLIWFTAVSTAKDWVLYYGFKKNEHVFFSRAFQKSLISLLNVKVGVKNEECTLESFLMSTVLWKMFCFKQI